MNNSTAWTVFLSLPLFLSFSFPVSARNPKRNPQDQKVLLEIDADLGIPVHFAPSDRNEDCCQWYNVECNTNYGVIQLTIFQANISGQIPAAVGDLPYLQVLMFHHVPNLTGTIPPSIVKLSNLNFLILSFNNLSGPTPTFLTKLKKLTFLDLSFNQFTGSIPPELSQFQNLGALHLERNQLTGTIPESFGHFTGSIPDLYLSRNHLTGTIPKSLANLMFHVLIFPETISRDASFLFGKNKTVQVLDLARNNLTFDLSNVEFPESLTSLELSHNRIFGSLPQELTQLALQLLNVSYNRLCGEIPQGGRLQSFDIYSYFLNRCLCGAPLPACK